MGVVEALGTLGVIHDKPDISRTSEIEHALNFNSYNTEIRFMSFH